MSKESLLENRKAVVIDEYDDPDHAAIIAELLRVGVVLDEQNPEHKELPVFPYFFRMKERMNANHYIDSALRSSRSNEVFIFCHLEYVVITYDPTSPGKGQVVEGPLNLCDGFPTLYNTGFTDYGVDAAFGCHGVNEAFLICGENCVKIEYGPDIRMGNAIGYPETLQFVFPCLETIGFHVDIDAAFESMVIDEAYLFQGSKYALLNYTAKTLINTGLITDEFPCLLNTKFASDIRAAFTSHLSNQAYLFKDDNSYVLIYYSPGKPNDSYIISGPEEIVPSNWPSLQGIVPFKKAGYGDGPKTWTPQWVAVGDIDLDTFDGEWLHTADMVSPPRICI